MPQGQLQRALSVPDVVALGVNAVIGTGIFLLPGLAFELMGPAAVTALLFGAVLSFLIGLCYAEVGSYFRGTGGAYLYAVQTFGPGVGFFVGWMTCVVTVVAWSALVNGLATALARYLPSLEAGWPRATFIVGFMLALTVVNLRGAKMGARVSNFFTIAKLLPLFLFVGVGLFSLDSTRFTPFAPAGYDNFFEATLLIFYAFVGFESLGVPAGEMANPRRAVPLAMVSVLGLVALVYLGVMVVATGTLPDLAGHGSPVAAASELFMGPVGGALVGAGIIASMLGINVASSLVGPRRFYALAEQGQLPPLLGRVSATGAPSPAIWLLFVTAATLAVAGSFQTLALISVVARFAQYITTCLAVLVLRRRGPLGTGDAELSRPEPRFRIPLGPVVPVLALGLCGWLLVETDRDRLLAGGLALLAGVPVYLWTRRFAGGAAASSDA